MTYGEVANAGEMCERRPACLRAWSRAPDLRDMAGDEILTYDDVELPAGRIADQLRAEQYGHFRGESWLEDGLTSSAVPGIRTAVGVVRCELARN